MAKEIRESSRYLARWRIAIVFDETENKPTIHGYTHDLSLNGVSVHTDHTVVSLTPVTVLLSPPMAQEGERQKLIEIRSKLAYSVYSGSNFCFRVGLNFVKFKNDGLQVLKGILDSQVPLSEIGMKR